MRSPDAVAFHWTHTFRDCILLQSPFANMCQHCLKFLPFYTRVQHVLLDLSVFSYIFSMCEHLRPWATTCEPTIWISETSPLNQPETLPLSCLFDVTHKATWQSLSFFTRSSLWSQYRVQLILDALLHSCLINLYWCQAEITPLEFNFTYLHCCYSSWYLSICVYI